MKTVLIIGAGGFAGGFIAQECLRRGWQVWAGVRASTSRRYLDDPRIRFLTLDFEAGAEAIAAALRHDAPLRYGWDYVVYNLGATKAGSYAEFKHINAGLLRSFLAAMYKAEINPQKFLYMSSLSVNGTDSPDYEPLAADQAPRPRSWYGLSKYAAELEVQASGLPYVIFRPTGIYGPREKDYYLMLKSIEKGVDFSVGFRRQMLTFIYVEDLARAVCQALEKAPAGQIYNIAEGRGYSQREFRSLAARILGKRFVLPVKAPLWLLRVVCKAGSLRGRFTGKTPTLNDDKYRILRQRNWLCDTAAAVRDFGFSPAVSLEQGLEESVAWYRREGWLKTPKTKP